MRTFGLIGFPLSHSFSPAYFADKFEREGLIGCSYKAFPITSISELPDLLAIHPNLEGLNITIPYKKQVIPFLSHSSPAVQQTTACNCIKIANGFLKGYNTDVIGFEKSLLPNLTGRHTKALILGTGGAASAVEYVLKKLNIAFLFVTRSNDPGAGNVHYNNLSAEMVAEHKLIINTTPVGMFPSVHEFPSIPYEFLSKEHYLYDLVYNPAETVFLKKGAEKGAVVKNGADMLIIQAEESWKIWNVEGYLESE